MNTSLSPILRRAPLRETDGIPVFSVDDAYTDNYKRIAEDHLAAMAPGHDNPYIENELWVELEQSTRHLITKYVPTGGRVLDVGVGLGRVLGPLAAYERHGIDISIEYLKRARASGFEVAYSRVEDMPFADGVFDAVVCCDVLEHVTGFDEAVRQILRVLKPGGHLIMRVPYREDLKVYLQEGLPYEFIHLRNFDENSVRLYFEKICRCQVLETTFIASYWQGETRLRYRLPRADSKLRELVESGSLESLGMTEPLARIVRALASMREEELVEQISAIKVLNPALFKALQPHLILEIEMNAVIRKP